EDRTLGAHGACARALRSAAGGVPPVPQAASSDLPEDRGLWPLRPGGPRLHLGAHGQGGYAAWRGRPGRRDRGGVAAYTSPTGWSERPCIRWMARSTVRTISRGPETPTNLKSKPASAAVSKSTVPTRRMRSSADW